MDLPRPLTEQEETTVRIFTQHALRLADETNFDIEKGWSLQAVAAAAEIDLNNIPKEGVLIQALWVAFLNTVKQKVPLSSLKYPTLESFRDAYGSYFANYQDGALLNLWQTANWMNELFRHIPARKNKGLAMAIVPKVVEGWYAKYITGSGQTKATADRVHIFETEGDVKPNHRGKTKSRKPSSSSSSGGGGGGVKNRVKGAKRAKAALEDNGYEDDIDDEENFYPIPVAVPVAAGAPVDATAVNVPATLMTPVTRVAFKKSRASGGSAPTDDSATTTGSTRKKRKLKSIVASTATNKGVTPLQIPLSVIDPDDLGSPDNAKLRIQIDRLLPIAANMMGTNGAIEGALPTGPPSLGPIDEKMLYDFDAAPFWRLVGRTSSTHSLRGSYPLLSAIGGSPRCFSPMPITPATRGVGGGVVGAQNMRLSTISPLPTSTTTSTDVFGILHEDVTAATDVDDSEYGFYEETA